MTHSPTAGTSGTAGTSPVCLLCRIIPVRPDAVAGLCVSCQWSIRRGPFAVSEDAGGIAIVHLHAASGDPLGFEDTTRPAPVYPYNPADLFPDGATLAELAAVRAQLLDLANGPRVCNRKVAKEILSAIRATGCTVAINAGLGGAELSEPERVPYPLIVRYVRHLHWIEDALTREEARRIKREEDRYAREVARQDKESAERGELFT